MMWWSGILNGNNNLLPVFHVASSGCCWEALDVYVWAVVSLHSSGWSPKIEHDQNSQLRVKGEKNPNKIICLSAESPEEEGITGGGGRDCYQKLHFLCFRLWYWSTGCCTVLLLHGSNKTVKQK